jgi:non-heme chloroperoxidase
MPPHLHPWPAASRRDALISASALAASFTFPRGTARTAGPATHVPEREHTVGFVTTDDDVQIFYKDWGPKDARSRLPKW